VIVSLWGFYLVAFPLKQASLDSIYDRGRWNPSPRLADIEKGEAMTHEDILSRIAIDPNVCFGKPCIKGHRIWVSLILDFLASGCSIPEILENYPGVEEADVRACIAYGAHISPDPFTGI
jgi:uncharacterized protein (DUF433 family)